MADWGKAIQLKPDDARAYLLRGAAWAEKGETDKAIADFKKVLDLSDDPQLRRYAEGQLQALGAR
jgi:Flp pilus assembly protein TadD